jgi:uncharacterized protein DUF1572
MSVIASIEAEYKRYKALAEAAITQVGDEELMRTGPGESNSIEMLVRHLTGNLRSRFTDFRTSDGEKPWRHRDDEFEPASLGRARLLAEWDEAWQVLFSTLAELSDDDLSASITVRRQPLRIDEALHRSLAHAAYHVGQIVYLAKAMRAHGWHCLSIPRGASQAYNQAPTNETAVAHTSKLVTPGGSGS